MALKQDMANQIVHADEDELDHPVSDDEDHPDQAEHLPDHPDHPQTEQDHLNNVIRHVWVGDFVCVT